MLDVRYHGRKIRKRAHDWEASYALAKSIRREVLAEEVEHMGIECSGILSELIQFEIAMLSGVHWDTIQDRWESIRESMREAMYSAAFLRTGCDIRGERMPANWFETKRRYREMEESLPY